MIALAAGGSRLELLARQALAWEVPVVAVTGGEEDLADHVREALTAAAAEAGRPDPVTTILTGPDAATMAVESAGLGPQDTVVNGITGSVGLLPTLAALHSGARLALATRSPSSSGAPWSVGHSPDPVRSSPWTPSTPPSPRPWPAAATRRG